MAARLWLAALLLAPTLVAQDSGGSGEGGHSLRSHRSRGASALPTLLRLAASGDIDLRLRARRTATHIVMDFYRGRTPAGMRLIAGRVVFAGDRVSMRGGLYLAVLEVKTREFLAYATEKKMRAKRWEDLDPDQPVANITFAEAKGYAAWRGARLPTANELLAAATCGGNSLYPWGNRFEARRVNSRESGLGRSLSGGSRTLGRSTHGVQDLLGNVAEWTSTASSKRRSRFCVCGGSFMRSARGVIASKRFVSYKLRPTEWRKDVGLRLARTLPGLPDGREATKELPAADDGGESGG